MTIDHDHDQRRRRSDGAGAAKDQPGRFTDGYYGTPNKTAAATLGRRRAL